MPKPNRNLSSRDLLNRNGLNETAADNLLQDEHLDDLLHDLESDHGAVLRARYEQLNRPHHFRRGDLVCWKPGLRNRRVQAYGTPAVVLEVLAEPIPETVKESGST